MTFKHMWVYEQSGDSPPRRFASVIAIDPNTVISAQKLMEWTGRRLFISADGSAANLRDVKFFEVEINEPLLARPDAIPNDIFKLGHYHDMFALEFGNTAGCIHGGSGWAFVTSLYGDTASLLRQNSGAFGRRARTDRNRSNQLHLVGLRRSLASNRALNA